MGNTSKIIVFVALVVAVVAVMSLKQLCPCRAPRKQPPPPVADVSTPPAASQPDAVATAQSSTVPGALPRLVDLGADKCVPCKMMEPVLEELRHEYADQLRVEFYDVWKDPRVGRQYGIQVIPTQIFFDAAGNELFRHEGFLSKEDILGKWKELGIDLQGGGK